MRNSMKVAFIAAALLAAACSDSATPTSPTPGGSYVAVDSIGMYPTLIRLGTVGDRMRPLVWWHPLNATNQGVTWSSSNPAVASVDSSGMITAVAQGAEVVITATTNDGEHQASTRVQVGVQGPAIKD
jgi:hypothetical protein